MANIIPLLKIRFPKPPVCQNSVSHTQKELELELVYVFNVSVKGIVLRVKGMQELVYVFRCMCPRTTCGFPNCHIAKIISFIQKVEIILNSLALV